MNKHCLIKPEELKLIREEWIESGDIQDSLPEIYENVYNEKVALVI